MPNARSRGGVVDDPSGMGPFFEGITPGLHSLLRIGAALLFMQHGVQKLFGWLGGMGGPGQTAELFSQLGLAGVLEFFGGLLILVGLFTRPVALILAAEMIAAYFIGHAPQGGAPVQNQGELALLYALIFAFLFGAGAGPLSIDRSVAGRRTRTAAPRAPSEVPEAPSPPGARG